MAEKLDATFFAFRKRERSGALLGATLLYVVITSVLFAAFVYLNWNSLGSVFAWFAELASLSDQAQTNPDMIPPPPPGFFIALLSYLLFLFPIYLTLAAYEAACLRWLLRGETGGLLGFTLGADTWRCYGGYWVWLLLNFGASLATSLLAMLVSVTAWRDASSSQRELLELPFNVIALYFWLRLAPANATSVGLGEFAFFKAWTVTRDRTTALFGSYLIVALLYLAVAAAVIAAGYFLLWPTLAPHYAGGALADFGEVQRVYSEAFASTQFVATTGALFLILTVAGLFIYLFHFGICARAVLAAMEDGKIEKAAPAA